MAAAMTLGTTRVRPSPVAGRMGEKMQAHVEMFAGRMRMFRRELRSLGSQVWLRLWRAQPAHAGTAA
jgi:hypothetical protein